MRAACVITAGRCSGLSLIELMIAMALGLSLSAGVMRVYTDSSHLQHEQMQRLRMQENGRFAMHFLSRELRKAGYSACPLSETDASSSDYNGPGITGWSRGQRNAPFDGLDALPGSDIVALWYRAACEPGSLRGTVFHLAHRGRDAGNPPALFRREIDADGIPGPAEELVEGIENLRIHYGVDRGDLSHGAVRAWLQSEEVDDWGRVVSVRVTVLVQSIADNMVSRPKPYHFNGVMHDGTAGNGKLPGDRRLRQTFSVAINLRNMALYR